MPLVGCRRNHVTGWTFLSCLSCLSTVITLAARAQTLDDEGSDEIAVLQNGVNFVKRSSLSDGATSSQSATKTGLMASQSGRTRKRWQLQKGARLNEVLVVPSLKLIFCFIPKNAGTQFNRLMNALNGIDKDGAICSREDPNYASTMHGNFTASDLEHALNDPSWTKAAFLRDPLERLVSAYLSKCVEPHECGGCMGVESDVAEQQSFYEVADRLEFSDNAHFLAQGKLCGGLAENIGAFNYVGHISSDTKAVSQEVAEMLMLAIQRYRSNHTEALLQSGEDLRVWKHNKTLPQFPLSNFGNSVSREESRVLEIATRYFPATGPDHNDPHVHVGRNASDLFDMFSLVKALDAYSDDYDKLPGLRRPSWAYRVTSYYDAVQVLPRPKWLPEGKPPL